MMSSSLMKKLCAFHEEINSHNKDQFEGGIKTNVAVASFVTAQARLHLYKELEKIDRRVLYCDTD